jgi:hypothetical protein
VFPGYKDKRVGIGRLQQCPLEFTDLVVPDLGIHRHPDGRTILKNVLQ